METQASILWEIIKNIAFVDRSLYPQEAQYTEQDFDDLVAKNPNDWVGTNWLIRATFLADNGYDFTADNIVNSSLPSQPDILAQVKPELADVYNDLPQDYWDTRDALQQQLDSLDAVIQQAAQDPTQTADLASDAVQAVQSVVTISTIQPSPIQPAPPLGD